MMNNRTLIHSSSTSHLFPQQRREQQQQPLEDVRKRFSSSEGRFSIIDERSKDSSSSDTDDEPLPNLFSVPHRIPPPSSFSRSVELPAGTMASATSRFRIVPVESRYKRGRWECFDYYQKEVTRCPKISCPALPPPNIPKTDRFVRSWTTDLVPPATAPPSQGPSFKFEVSSDSDRENSDPTPRKKVPTDVVVPSGRMTPTEMLQTGLESTLNTSDIKKDVAIIDSSATSHNGNSPAMVAIDSKIEQAMDLVKTHLMYAVREEVDVLRQKIGDLEAHIHQLESENAVLREHVPTDVLGGLHGK